MFLTRLFPYDKNLHIVIGMAAFLAGALAAHLLGAPWYIGVAVGLAVTYLAGVWKELYDSFRQAYHTQDEWDYRATMSGGVALALVDVFVQLWWVHFA